MTVVFGNELRYSIENLELDRVGVLELIDHKQTEVGCNIILDLLVLFISEHGKKYFLHVIKGDYMVLLFVLVKFLLPAKSKIEDGVKVFLDLREIVLGHSSLVISGLCIFVFCAIIKFFLQSLFFFSSPIAIFIKQRASTYA